MELKGNLNYNKKPENYGLHQVIKLLDENKIFKREDEKNFVTLQFLFALGINSNKDKNDYNYTSDENFDVPIYILKRNYSSIILMLFAAYDRDNKYYSQADLQDIVSNDLMKYKYLISDNLMRGYLEFEEIEKNHANKNNIEKYIMLNEILKRGF